jgi:hypothetical protein
MFCGRRIDDPASMDWWVAPVDGGKPVQTWALENLALKSIVQYPTAGSEIMFILYPGRLSRESMSSGFPSFPQLGRSQGPLSPSRLARA